MFSEIYSEFNYLFKKWIISQSILDIIFITCAVVCVMNEKMTLFGIAFGTYFIGQIIIISKVFGSVKRFGDYLNLRGNYQSAIKNDNESKIKEAENRIIEFMKKDTVN